MGKTVDDNFWLLHDIMRLAPIIAAKIEEELSKDKEDLLFLTHF
jgi:hypothetical protein